MTEMENFLCRADRAQASESRLRHVIRLEVAEVIGAKLLALLIGAGICAVGFWMMRFGEPIITALNRGYARLPFKFQYPLWWHRFTGALFVGIGLLFAIAGLVFAQRLP